MKASPRTPVLPFGRRHAQRAVLAVIGIGRALAVLGAPEVGQHVGIAPAAAARLRPAVIVARMAAHIHHAVDGGGAAQHAAARMAEPPVVEIRLRLGRVGPVEAVVGEQPPEARRHVDRPVAIDRPRFQQQDAHIRVLGQARRQHAAGRSGADDDVVEGLHPRALHRLVHQLVEVVHQVLALVAALRIDQVAALVVAEGAQAPLLRDVELDVLGPELLVHPLDAGLGHLRHRPLRAVIAEAQQRFLRPQRDHEEGPADVREREAIERRVGPDADVEERVGLPGRAVERRAIGDR